jgi:hypothetical protein
MSHLSDTDKALERQNQGGVGHLSDKLPRRLRISLANIGLQPLINYMNNRTTTGALLLFQE